MHRFLSWFLVCLFVAVSTYGLSSVAMWEMRSRFLPGYHDGKILCERRSLQTLTSAHEEDPATTLSVNSALAEAKECHALLTSLADYKQSVPKRALFFSVVVFLATLIVRFVMFPLRAHPRAHERPADFRHRRL